MDTRIKLTIVVPIGQAKQQTWSLPTMMVDDQCLSRIQGKMNYEQRKWMGTTCWFTDSINKRFETYSKWIAVAGRSGEGMMTMMVRSAPIPQLQSLNTGSIRPRLPGKSGRHHHLDWTRPRRSWCSTGQAHRTRTHTGT